MPEKWYKSEELKVDYICDECGKGKMFPLIAKDLAIGVGLDSYPHICQECGAVKNLDHIYPGTVHKPMTPVKAERERNENTEG